MKAIRALFLLIIPVAVAAHPGGGLIALDANTVIFGDSMYNSVWRLEHGKKPQALARKFHALLSNSKVTICSRGEDRKHSEIVLQPALHKKSETSAKGAAYESQGQA